MADGDNVVIGKTDIPSLPDQTYFFMILPILLNLGPRQTAHGLQTSCGSWGPRGTNIKHPTHVHRI
jgi:hypothetical protein